MNSVKISTALLWIFLSTLVVSGSICLIYYFCKSNELSKSRMSQYNITTIVQTGPQREALKTLYLAELLNLSFDKPTNIYAFNESDGEKKLLASPLIKEAKIKKYPPDVLYIDYTVRQPVALLADYENVAIDADGHLFPVIPFLSPKELPEIFLGLLPFNEAANNKEGGRWDRAFSTKESSLALEILQLLSATARAKNFKIIKIDVSRAFSLQLGKREIILLIENEQLIKKNNQETLCILPFYLRLSTTHFRQELGNFLILNQQMLRDYQNQLSSQTFSLSSVRFKPKVLDFRIPGVAYIGGGD